MNTLRLKTRISLILILSGLIQSGVTQADAGIPVPRLTWSDCSATLNTPGAECASLPVPYNYARPQLGNFTLRVARKMAAKKTDQYLFFNFGGPGVQTTDGILAFSGLNENYNIITFDPRGIGNRNPALTNAPYVDCGVDDQQLGVLAKPIYTPLNFSRPDWINRSRLYAANCSARNRDILPHVSTANVARDIDLLRQTLGVPKISFYGVSYGTYLGVTYASLFPKGYHAMVLDAPVDPVSNIRHSFLEGQAGGWTIGFDRFFQGCLKNRKACQYFGGDPTSPSNDLAIADPQAAFDDLVDRYNKTPGLTNDNRPVDGNDFILAGQTALYGANSWGNFATALSQAANGSLGYIKFLSDQRYNTSGQRFLDAFSAIQAADMDSLPTPSDLSEEGYRAWENFKYGFMLTGYSKLNIKYLQSYAPAQGAYYGPFKANPNAAKILVIGGRFDPATPYQFAQKLTQTLGNAQLLTNVSDGHGSYNGGSDCVQTAVNNYFNTLTLPANTVCADQVNEFLKPTGL